MATFKDKAVNLSEFKELAKIINRLPKEFTGDDRKEMLGKAGVIVRDAIRQEAPQSSKAHMIIKEGGGYRKVKPGNLKRAVQMFTFKRTSDVFVGVIGSKRSRAKSIKGHDKVTRRHRAFYWMFIYYGTAYTSPDRFIDRGEAKAEKTALSVLFKEATAVINKFITKHKLN